jgi:transmembrane sensor
MEDIYSILERHFQQKTTADEEKQVTRFQTENHQEYLVLKNLWFSNSKIEIKDFDSHTGWQQVQSIVKRKKSISMHPVKRVAAIAVLLIMGGLFAYFLSQKFENKPMLFETATLAQQTDSILLADGTTVWLNRNSKLYYPIKFNGKTRKVKLEGEAFFDVSKNPKKPFIVETSHSTITVLGTTFNINTNLLQTEVAVATGKVNVESGYTKTTVNLIPDQMATVTNSGLVKSQITNPNYLSWKTGVFLFEDTPLKDVVRDLNTFYNKPIQLNTSNQEQLFSARFNQAKQADILEILKLTFNLNIQETPNSYEIN